MTKNILKLAAFGAFAFTQGCVSQFLETEPANPRYLIGPVSAERVSGSSVDWSLNVDNPKAAHAFDTSKVAVSRSAGRIEYFGDGEWAGRAPRVFQTALIESFQDSSRIVAVGDRQTLPLADYVLQTDIRMIDLDVSNGTPQARLSVYVRLTNGKSKIYAARAFSASQPTRSLDGDDVASSFDSVFKDVIADIVVWTFEQGEAREATAASS